ncbi:MAG: tyrosine-type recombinase/integrase [Verrucomicrobiota bacterium]|nr:tyrosine-type recombinase/integrase [Verrucomicrobiota bacterium]
MGSDPQSLLADLLEAARRRNLSPNSLLAYQRTWTQFLAWATASSFDARHLPFSAAQEAYSWLGDKKGSATIKQIRAALSFAYKHWDLKNPFAQIEPPLQNEPQIRYLMLADIRRLLVHLKARQHSYGSQLAFHLTNALFQTACRFDELVQLQWSNCQRVGEEIVALRIKGKGSVFQDVPVAPALSAALREWQGVQDSFKGQRIFGLNGINFAATQLVFAAHSGGPLSNRAFNLRLRAACRALGVGEITAHGLRHSAATILLNHVGKDLRLIQQLLRHKNIRTTVRYTHVGYEQTRATAEALSQVLG